jgi:hypothetical protein
MIVDNVRTIQENKSYGVKNHLHSSSDVCHYVASGTIRTIIVRLSLVTIDIMTITIVRLSLVTLSHHEKNDCEVKHHHKNNNYKDATCYPGHQENYN